MIKDIKNVLMQALAMFATAVTNATTNGAGIDTAHAISGMFTLSVPDYTDGSFVFKIQESPDNASWTDLPNDKYIGVLGVDDTINAAAVEGAAIKSLGCFSNDRYIRLVCTSTGVGTAATIVSHAVLTPELCPNDYPGS